MAGLFYFSKERMDIQTISIGAINPAVYNPRKDLGPGDPDYEKLRKSMEEFDYIDSWDLEMLQEQLRKFSPPQ